MQPIKITKKTINEKRSTIIGIDPGIADTGWGIIECAQHNLKMIACGSIKTDKKETIENRLTTLAEELNKIIKKHQPNLASVEKIFFFKNQKTVINVSQARGVAILTLNQNGLPINEYTPLQVKQTLTGYGSAQKKQVGLLVKLLLKLKDVPKPDDVADALAIAITAARFNNLN